MNFQQTYDAVKDKRLVVEKVTIVGLDRTKAYVVSRELEPVKDARSLDEIKDVLLEAHEHLQSLGIFDGVEVIITDSETGQIDACTILVRCAEKGRLNLHAGTYVNGNDGSLEFALGLTNVLGRAEEVSLSAELGMNNLTEFSLSVSKPRLGGRPRNTTVGVYQKRRSFAQYSSYSEETRGGTATLFSPDGTHAVAYDLAWCKIRAEAEASAAVRRQTGHKLKSALSYIFRHYTLDDLQYPTSGMGFRSSSEIAGLGPDANLLRFAKQHVAAQWVHPLIGSSVFSLSAEAGVVLPWGPGWQAKPTYISERFFLGGVHGNLRGFHFKGAGPVDTRQGREGGVDALGGDMMCAILAEIRFQLPVAAMRAAGMYGHAFLNGGNAAQLSGTGRPLKQTLKDFVRVHQTWRWSAGVGLVWPTSLGRLEVNLCKVLKHQMTDRFTAVGLQVGFTPTI
ncbi:g9256 [Coccomyxa elongata]